MALPDAMSTMIYKKRGLLTTETNAEMWGDGFAYCVCRCWLSRFAGDSPERVPSGGWIEPEQPGLRLRWQVKGYMAR